MRFLVIAVLILVFGSFKSDSKLPNNSSHGIDETEKNKELIKRVFTYFASKRNLSYMDSLYAVNFIDHAAFEGKQRGLAEFKKVVNELSVLFSHIEINIEDIVAEKDVVSTRESWKVIRASDNKPFTGETMHWFRLKDGKIIEEWSKGWEWVESAMTIN